MKYKLSSKMKEEEIISLLEKKAESLISDGSLVKAMKHESGAKEFTFASSYDGRPISVKVEGDTAEVQLELGFFEQLIVGDELLKGLRNAFQGIGVVEEVR